MRAVLGIMFVVLGIGGGYLILSGKFPASGATPATGTTATPTVPANTTQGISSAPGFGSPNASQQNHGGPSPSVLGVPTMKQLQDMPATAGRFS